MYTDVPFFKLFAGSDDIGIIHNTNLKPYTRPEMCELLPAKVISYPDEHYQMVDPLLFISLDMFHTVAPDRFEEAFPNNMISVEIVGALDSDGQYVGDQRYTTYSGVRLPESYVIETHVLITDYDEFRRQLYTSLIKRKPYETLRELEARIHIDAEIIHTLPITPAPNGWITIVDSKQKHYRDLSKLSADEFQA